MNKPQTTETLDKLYLEWSQFTNARTARELLLEAKLDGMDKQLDALVVQSSGRADQINKLREALSNQDLEVDAMKRALTEAVTFIDNQIGESLAADRVIRLCNEAILDEEPSE